MPENPPLKSTRPVAAWLYLCAAAVALMALIGAITRLTESGLSIVEWKPLTGLLPPLTGAAWDQQFALYQTSPEYRLLNVGMSLPEFQRIFFWEWLHRTWAHLIGALFLLPFLYFWIARRISAWLLPRLLGLFALGGLQGLIGWFMVASGLVDRPSVSHYRLALHLGTAFLIAALLLWNAYALSVPRLVGDQARLRKLGWALLPLPLVTMLFGVFVAGLKAGYIHNTFPLMGGQWTPPEALTLHPVLLNFVAAPPWVQFTHRWLAIATAFAVLAFAARLARVDRRVALALGAAVLLQVSLGIATLLSVVQIDLAATHQAGALLLLSVYLLALYRLGRNRVEPEQKKRARSWGRFCYNFMNAISLIGVR